MNTIRLLDIDDYYRVETVDQHGEPTQRFETRSHELATEWFAQLKADIGGTYAMLPTGKLVRQAE